MDNYLNFGYDTQEEWDALTKEEKVNVAYEHYLSKSLDSLSDSNLLDGWYQDINDAMSQVNVPDDLTDEIMETIDSGHGIGKGSFNRKKFSY